MDLSKIMFFGKGLRVNSLPNNKISNWCKLKALADDKINVTEKLKVILGRVENIVGKGENAGYQHFLLFHLCFQKASYTGLLKSGLPGKELNFPICFPFHPKQI